MKKILFQKYLKMKGVRKKWRKKYPFKRSKNIWKTVRKVQKEVKRIKKGVEVKCSIWDENINTTTGIAGEWINATSDIIKGTGSGNIF